MYNVPIVIHNLFSLRPYSPSHNQATTETAENRAPPSDHDSVSDAPGVAEARKSVLSGSQESISENQETAVNSKPNFPKYIFLDLLL